MRHLKEHRPGLCSRSLLSGSLNDDLRQSDGWHDEPRQSSGQANHLSGNTLQLKNRAAITNVVTARSLFDGPFFFSMHRNIAFISITILHIGKRIMFEKRIDRQAVT